MYNVVEVFMDTTKRREKILDILAKKRDPVSASELAKRLDVSRQIIVSDVALLRAQGKDIIATPRGYMTAPRQAGRYIGKILCRHDSVGALAELSAIVNLGGEVIDVTVTHPFYGDLTGQLNLSTQSDVDAFMKLVLTGKEKLLSELTGGLHFHTISCADKATFDKITAELSRLGVLSV
jgi:transcriptional regulator of NAD metabolism